MNVDQNERAAYQAAVESAKAEIARLRTDLQESQRDLERARAALDAERAARVAQAADMAAIVDGINAWARASPDERGAHYTRLFALMIADSPGAALLAELRDRAEKAETKCKAWTAIGARSEADALALYEALEDRHSCENCGGKGSYWTDVDGEAEHEVCDCWIRADHVLYHEEHPGAALLTELVAARSALDQIDRHIVGACESESGGMPEPCEECGEMREIASQALKAMQKAREG